MTAALAFCLNVSSYTPGVFSFGSKSAGGCEVDLDGGQYLTSQQLYIPVNISNLRIGGGSLIASPSFPKDEYMIKVGDMYSCMNPQGSCNEDLGFPELFLDGSGLANGYIIICNHQA